jgi:hypothetical protein
MLVTAAGVVADIGLQPRVRRRVWREDPGGPRTVATSTNPSIRFAWSSPAASNPSMGGEAVKRIRERVAGLDVHRDTVVACCQVKQPDRSIEVTKQSFATTANGLGQLAAWLSDTGVETVAMEATGVYWKPVYYCLEGLFDELWLCNAQYEEPAIMQNELAGFPFVPA